MARRKQPEAEPPLPDTALPTSEELPPSDTNGTAPLDESGTPLPPEEKERPVYCLSVPAGTGVSIEVAVWPRVIQLDGKDVTVYNATFKKHYRVNGRWDSTTFFRGSELHLVEYLARRASEWILGQRTVDCPF